MAKLVSPVSGSVYRGQARNGLGEGPGRSIEQGEQYLAADPPFDADSALLDEIRPWMTLDSSPRDQEALGDRLEAWACLPADDAYLVIRLVPAGLYDRRTAYFAHGRAWPLETFAGDFDPGTLFGCSELFDRPWRDVRPPHVDVPRQVPRLIEPEVTIRLLAHLYQARVGGYPVILAVPVSEFVTGGRIHGIVRFARAALPLPLKRDARIRVYTRIADHYLRRLEVDLLAIPEDEAGTALSARRDATLLDRLCQRVDGREPDAGALRYAEDVATCAEQNPEGLLPFAAGVTRLAWATRLPEPSEARLVSFIYHYHLAGRDGAKLGAFLRNLFSTFNKTPATIAWQAVLDAGDFADCPTEDLAELVLDEARTDDALALQRLAEAAARKRSLSLDAQVAAGGEPPARRLIELLSLGLVSERAVQPRLRALGAEEIAALVSPRPVAKGLLALLLKLTGAGDLSRDWLQIVAEHAPDDVLFEVARNVFPLAARGDDWRGLADGYVRRLARLEAPPPDLGVSLAALSPPPLSRLPDYLLFVEVLARARHRNARGLVAQLRGKVTARGDRRMVVSAVGGKELTCLQDFNVPEDWWGDVADLALRSAALRPRGIDDLIRLGRQVWTGPAAPDGFVEGVDAWMAADPVSTTRALVQSRAWLGWRLHARLLRDASRRASLAWLRCRAGGAGQVGGPDLEEWKQALQDVEGTLSADDLAQIRPVPIIEGFVKDQAVDLGQAARDVAALAELGHGLFPGEVQRVAVDRIEGALRRAAGAERTETRARLGAWLCDRRQDFPSYQNLLAAVEALLTGDPGGEIAHHAARDTANALLLRRQPNLARFVSRKAVDEETLDARLRKALLARDVHDTQWWELERLPTGPATHVVTRLVRSLTNDATVTPGPEVWKSFLQAAASHPILVRATVDGEALPALGLGLAMMPDAGVGTIAEQIVFGRAGEAARTDIGWCDALCRGIAESAKKGRRADMAFNVLHTDAEHLGITHDVRALTAAMAVFLDDRRLPLGSDRLDDVRARCNVEGRGRNSMIVNQVTFFADGPSREGIDVADNSTMTYVHQSSSRRRDLRSNDQPPGLQVRTRPDSERSVHVAVRIFPTDDYVPPTQALQLTPGKTAEFVPLKDGERTISILDHLIVPVDARAQQALHRFHEDLAWLPPDDERAVLNVLRNPGLEWRVSRLEEALSSRNVRERPGRKRDVAWSLLRRHWKVAGAISLILVSVVLASVFLPFIVTEVMKRVGGDQRSAPVQTAPVQPTPQPAARATEDKQAQKPAAPAPADAGRRPSEVLDAKLAELFKAAERSPVNGAAEALLFRSPSAPASVAEPADALVAIRLILAERRNLPVRTRESIKDEIYSTVNNYRSTLQQYPNLVVTLYCRALKAEPSDVQTRKILQFTSCDEAQPRAASELDVLIARISATR